MKTYIEKSTKKIYWCFRIFSNKSFSLTLVQINRMSLSHVTGYLIAVVMSSIIHLIHRAPMALLIHRVCISIIF